MTQQNLSFQLERDFRTEFCEESCSCVDCHFCMRNKTMNRHLIFNSLKFGPFFLGKVQLETSWGAAEHDLLTSQVYLHPNAQAFCWNLIEKPHLKQSYLYG